MTRGTLGKRVDTLEAKAWQNTPELRRLCLLFNQMTIEEMEVLSRVIEEIQKDDLREA